MRPAHTPGYGPRRTSGATSSPSRRGSLGSDESEYSVGGPKDGHQREHPDGFRHLPQPRRRTFIQSLAFADWDMEESAGKPMDVTKGKTSELIRKSGSVKCTRIRKLISSNAFRITMNSMILLNAVQLGLSVDVRGHMWNDVWRACDHAFTAIFLTEMVLMLSVLGIRYFQDNWLLLDFIVVIVSTLDAWIFPIVGVSQNVGFFRVCRLLRLLRIAKLTRVVPELTVVVEGLLNSMKSLIWIFVLLGVFLYAGAICCVEVIGSKDSGYPSFDDGQSDINDELVENFNNYIYYGSVYRSMFTLFGIVLLSEWPLIRPVMELHSAMVPFFILLVCVVAFGVLNVIIGIVVDKTMEAMQEYREEAKENQNRQKSEAAESIADLMFDIDLDGDGRITHEEMEASLQNEKMVEYLRRLDLPYNFSTGEFIHMLDVDGNGSLSKSEFVGGLFRLIFCTEFQRDCLHQMAIGAFHNSMHQVSLQLKKDLHDAITEISHEVRATITGSWEPLKPGLGKTSQRLLVPEKPVGAIPPDLGAHTPDTGASFQACPRGPDYKVLDIHTRTIQASWEPLRTASTDGIPTSFTNPSFDASGFHNPQVMCFTADSGVAQDVIGNRWHSSPPYMQVPRAANAASHPTMTVLSDVREVSC